MDTVVPTMLWMSRRMGERSDVLISEMLRYSMVSLTLLLWLEGVPGGRDEEKGKKGDAKIRSQ